jgi:hypothetical protein
MSIIKSSVSVCTLLLASTAIAQESREQTLESLRKTGAHTLTLDQVGRVLTQSEDIGTLELVKKTAPPSTLRLATAQSIFYTDNVLLTELDRIDSVGWYGWFNAVFVPYSTYRWTPSVSFEQHLIRYENSSSSDFDGQILSFASVLHLNESKTWSWSASYALWRLYSVHGAEKEFHKQGELANSIWWYLPLTPNQTLALRTTARAAWRHVSPSFLDRFSATVGTALSYVPIDSIEFAPFINFDLRFYPTDTAVIHDRRDFRIESGASLTWWPHKNISLGASFIFTENYSNNDRLDYEELLPSAGMAATIRF